MTTKKTAATAKGKTPANRQTNDRFSTIKDDEKTDATANFRKSDIEAMQNDPSLAQLVDARDIKEAKFQVRKSIDPKKWEPFVESISNNGVLQNLILRRLDNNDLELIAGQRRKKGAIETKRYMVPAVILENISDSQALKLMMEENDRREAINEIDQTAGIIQLLQYELELDSHEEVIKVLGAIKSISTKITPENKSRLEAQTSTIQGVLDIYADGIKPESFLKVKVPLLKLPETLQEAVRNEKISYTAALSLNEIRDQRLREEALVRCTQDDLSVRAVKALVNDITKQSSKKEPKGKSPKNKSEEKTPQDGTENNPETEESAQHGGAIVPTKSSTPQTVHVVIEAATQLTKIEAIPDDQQTLQIASEAATAMQKLLDILKKK